MDIIYPATSKHILKFTSQPMYVVQETEEIYQTITLPHILDNSLSLQVCFFFKWLDTNIELIVIKVNNYIIQWVYNCLEYKSEKERIAYDTASENQKNDEDNGFLLIPDLKWSGKLNELYLLAIVKKRNIKSLRDLTADHLTLLKNILNKGSVCILIIFWFSLIIVKKFWF